MADSGSAQVAHLNYLDRTKFSGTYKNTRQVKFNRHPISAGDFIAALSWITDVFPNVLTFSTNPGLSLRQFQADFVDDQIFIKVFDLNTEWTPQSCAENIRWTRIDVLRNFNPADSSHVQWAEDNQVLTNHVLLRDDMMYTADDLAVAATISDSIEAPKTIISSADADFLSACRNFKVGVWRVPSEESVVTTQTEIRTIDLRQNRIIHPMRMIREAVSMCQHFVLSQRQFKSVDKTPGVTIDVTGTNGELIARWDHTGFMNLFKSPFIAPAFPHHIISLVVEDGEALSWLNRNVTKLKCTVLRIKWALDKNPSTKLDDILQAMKKSTRVEHVLVHGVEVPTTLFDIEVKTQEIDEIANVTPVDVNFWIIKYCANLV